MRTDLASECLKKSECMPEGVVFHRQPLGSGAIELAEIISEEAMRKTGKHQQHQRVLSSGDTYCNSVSGLNHIIIIHAAANEAH